MSTFAGQVALVTGGGSGIGRATALMLHQEGAGVAILDRDGDAAHAVTEEIEQSGGRAAAFIIDLADSPSVPPVVTDVVERFGRLDILVNSAGIAGQGPLLELGASEWDTSLAINLTAPFLLTQAFGRHVAQRGKGGKIVNVLSSSLYRAFLLSGPDYVASKGGLLGLTRASAAFLGELDMNVNAVAPGVTDTPMLRAHPASQEEPTAGPRRRAPGGPLANVFNRVSTADDVASVIVFLCSPASRQITGQVVHTSAGAVL